MSSTRAADLPIGKLSAATGVKVPTIRFYEQIGLMAAPPRTDGGRRLYDPAAVRRLAFIRHARQLGFDLSAIRSLLDISTDPDRPCADANAIALARLAEVRARLRSLKALEKELARMSRACEGGEVGSCRAIEVLSDHDLCEVREHPPA
ncbi:MerR family transcriptional regulator [Brevundimonas diminuta ATCC 11568]